MRRFPKLSHKEFNIFKKLDTPGKIQGFVNRIPINFERDGETCRSPLSTLRQKKAHCMEGALLAAAMLWYHGEEPLLMDLKTTSKDMDHAVALFRRGNRWGAISKTNHAVLRYRDAVYKTPRELAMSYFNEYFLDNGVKTLRSHSAPFSLLRYGEAWLTSEKDLWDVNDALDYSRHFPVAKNISHFLRLADQIEIKAGKLVEWKKKS